MEVARVLSLYEPSWCIGRLLHMVSMKASLYRRDITLYRIGLTVEPTKYKIPERDI